MKVKEVQTNIKALEEKLALAKKEYFDTLDPAGVRQARFREECKKDPVWKAIDETATAVYALKKATQSRYRTWKMTAQEDWDVDFEDLDIEKALTDYVDQLEDLHMKLTKDAVKRSHELPGYKVVHDAEEHTQQCLTEVRKLRSQVHDAWVSLLDAEDLPVSKEILIKAYEAWLGSSMPENDHLIVDVENDGTVTIRVPELINFSIDTEGEGYDDLRDHPDWCLEKLCRETAEAAEDTIKKALPEGYEVFVWADDDHIEDIEIDGYRDDDYYVGKYDVSCEVECVVEIRK